MSSVEEYFMRIALRLAQHGHGKTSPNPTVGAVLVKQGRVIGRGRTAPVGGPHAEIQALRHAQRRGFDARGATLYVTLEPCCTHGRTPPCTDAIVAAGIRRVIVGATDPNPKHSGKGFTVLKRFGVEVFRDVLSEDCAKLNEAFNHWIVRRSPFVTVKAAMTLDGKIATANGESKWITGEKARTYAMRLRQESDAILVGVNTILADNPSLTVRTSNRTGRWRTTKPIRRIVLDSLARTPLSAKIVTDEQSTSTTIVVSKHAPKHRVVALAKRVNVLVAPVRKTKMRDAQGEIDLRWLLRRLGAEEVTSLLIEGGGEVNASFLLGGFAQRVGFFYAPKILGGRDARRAVGGEGVLRLADGLKLQQVEWRKVGRDLLLTARVKPE